MLRSVSCRDRRFTPSANGDPPDCESLTCPFPAGIARIRRHQRPRQFHGPTVDRISDEAIARRLVNVANKISLRRDSGFDFSQIARKLAASREISITEILRGNPGMLP